MSQNGAGSPRTTPGAPNRPWEPQIGFGTPNTFQNGSWRPKSEAQNGFGKPKTDGSKSAMFNAEMRGTFWPVGSGRVGSRRKQESANEPIPNAPRKKYAVRAHPSLRYIYIYIQIYICICIYINICIYIYIHVCIFNVYIYINTYRSEGCARTAHFFPGRVWNGLVCGFPFPSRPDPARPGPTRPAKTTPALPH